MSSPLLDPDVADVAPTDPDLTIYDEEHVVTYVRILDAAADSADWRDVARVILHIDPEREPARARTAYEMHLARARWMSSHGYKNASEKKRLIRGCCTRAAPT